MLDAVQPAEWENIMVRPKTDLQAWLGLVDTFSATETHHDLANAGGRDVPMQISQ